MNVLETKMAKAVNNWKSVNLGNTTVEAGEKVLAVRLHGNLIYLQDTKGREWFSDCGWQTRTTASRLKALGLTDYTYSRRRPQTTDKRLISGSKIMDKATNLILGL